MRTNRQQVEKKRLEVEKSIQGLKYRAEQINRRLKPLDVRSSIEAHDFSWVVNNAYRCQSEAQNSLANLTGKEQGYIEYATADILVNIGNFSFDCIELFLESQAISRRYELDTFSKLFKKSTGFLQYVLDMEVWSGWPSLRRVRPYIEELPQTKENAERSLRSFKHLQQHFEGLIALASKIDIGAEIKVAEALENECTYYWYSYTERKTFWEKALGKPIKLPSAELNHFQTLLVTDINPRIDVDMVIRQSQVLGLMTKLGEALAWHIYINDLTIQLAEELDVHKAAQHVVKKLLDDNGVATLVLTHVERAVEDTSPDLSDLGIRLINEYQVYAERANKVRGANFPELRASLERFITESDGLVRAHHQQLKDLKVIYEELYKRIHSFVQELEEYIGYVPKFSNESLKLFDVAVKDGSLILQEQELQGYSWLRETTDKMDAWLQRVEPTLNQTRNDYQAFEKHKWHIEKHLEEAQAEIEKQRSDVEKKWGWYKNQISPKIEMAGRFISHKLVEWRRLEKRQWADYRIVRAIAKCEQILKSSEEILDDLNQEIGKVKYKQAQLNSKKADINQLLKRKEHKLPPQDRQEIDTLVEIAMQADDYNFAEKSLNHAHTMAMRRATSQVRREVQNMITIHGNVKNSTIIAGNRNKIRR